MKLKGRHCRCSACGEYFNSAYTFDGHRVGPYAPINEPGTRRCLTVSEMQARDWLLNAAGFWISGRRPARAVAASAEAAICSGGA